MIYGFYLGQLHQSGEDIAGILTFITGLVGLIIGVILRFSIKKQQWYWNLVFGISGTLIVFLSILVYARIHG